MWRILTVDDEPDVRAIIAATLRSKFEVFEAKDGLDALEKIKRVEPDFVIMDVMMPLMDGLQACESIRKDPVFNQLPVLFLTALGAKDDIKKGYSVGANLYLTKPFDPMRLLKNVEVFFETTPPQRTKKRYTAEELIEAEKSGRMPIAPGASEFDLINRETVQEGVRRATPSQETWKMGSPGATARDLSPPPDQGKMLPRVLAVDDERAILDVMKLTLEGIVEFTWATDGIEAIEKLVKFQPDMLIIDVMLPKMSGYTLCQSLRANAAFASIPILVCSAKGAERDIHYARRMGANDYLVKPFQADELIQKIKDLQRTPGFRLRAKNLTYEQIKQTLEPKGGAANADVFSAEEDVRKSDPSSYQKAGTNSTRAMNDFLKNQGSKDAFDKSSDPKDKKRTRLLFGFGKGSDE